MVAVEGGAVLDTGSETEVELEALRAAFFFLMMLLAYQITAP